MPKRSAMPGGLLRWAEAIVTGDDGSEEGWGMVKLEGVLTMLKEDCDARKSFQILSAIPSLSSSSVGAVKHPESREMSTFACAIKIKMRHYDGEEREGTSKSRCSVTRRAQGIKQG